MTMTIRTLLLAVLLTAACAEDNPFLADPDAGWESSADHPVLAAYGTLSGGFGTTSFSDMDPALEGIQDGILLKFDEPIDPATITEASFELVTTYPLSAPVEITTLLFFPGEKTAVLRCTFASESAYLLTVLAGGVTDLDDHPLDANHNGLYDGAPLDDLRLTFSTGSAPMADITSPVGDSSWPQGGGVESLQPEIALVFVKGPMDPAQLTLENFTVVRTSDGRPVELRVTVLESDRIYCVPVAPLDYGMRYTITMSAAITDVAGNLFDTNGDGWIWPDEQDRTWDFQTVDGGGTHATPPTVLSATLDDDSVLVIEFRQSLTGRSVVMDPATFVAENIQCSDETGGIPLVFQPRIGGSGVVCFPQRAIVGAMMVHVSCAVADQYGNLLDGDGNGLGGTPGVDDWSGTPED